MYLTLVLCTTSYACGVFSDSHTPVLAMDWLNTSLLIAGGRPLGNGGEELVGGITAIDGLVCNERIEGRCTI